jgi:hypothetical protein
MEKKNDILVLNLPNIGDGDTINLLEQLVIQSKIKMGGYRIETKNLLIEVIVKHP